MDEQKKYTFKYLGLVFLWGGFLSLFFRAISLPSPVTAFFRAVVAAVFSYIAAPAFGKPFDIKAVKENLGPMLLGGLFLGLNWLGLYLAYDYTSVSTAIIMYNTEPIMLLLVSPFFFKEKLSAKQFACVAAAFIGLLLVSGPGAFSVSKSRELIGILFGLMGAVFYTATTIVNKRLKAVDPVTKTVFQFIVAAAALAPYIFTAYDFSTFSVGIKDIVLIFLLGAGMTAIPYFLYFDILTKLPSKTLAIICYIETVITVMVSALILREPIDRLDIAGAVLIIGAAIVSELVSEKPQNKTDSEQKGTGNTYGK